MTVLEAHVALAAITGDIIDVSNIVTTGTAITPSNMPDGARITAVIRDVCLTRALYDIYRGAIQSVASAPRSIASKGLQSLSPETTVKVQWIPTDAVNTSTILPTGTLYEFNFNQVTSGGMATSGWKPLYIYSMSIIKATGAYLPIPIKTGIEANGLMNSRNVQVADTFAVPTSNGLNAFSANNFMVDVYDRIGDIAGTDTIECSYLPLPAKIDSTTVGGINRIIEIDSIRIPTLLTLAQMYVHINAQDVESIDKYLPTMLDMQKG